MNKDELVIAQKYLSEKDPILGEVIKKVGILEIRIGGNYFVELLESIVSQQLSVKASDTIWKRFVVLFADANITAEAVMKVEDQKIREAGISWQKISYIKDLAKRTAESGILFEQFEIMSEEEIVTELVKVRGIGRWTAEMFLMFSMRRPDVFSYGDLGLRRAIQKIYLLKKEPTQNHAEKITNVWKPYRTVACRYLWKSLEL